MKGGFRALLSGNLSRILDANVQAQQEAVMGSDWQIDWQGVFPALMTEFSEDGALDLEATQRHIQSSLLLTLLAKQLKVQRVQS